MPRILSILLLAPCLLADSPVRAHHAFAADYEAGNEGTISGRIVEVMFRNPHARYYLEVTGEQGTAELWDLETLNLMMLGRMGWKKDTIKVGDEVTVTGILGRNNTKRMSIVTVTLENGRTISPFRSNTRTNVELNAGTGGGEALSGTRSKAADVSAGNYELDDRHAYLTFSYSHMGLSRPIVHFSDFDGSLTLNGRDMSSSQVAIAIDASSVDTGVPELNESLRSEDFFAVADYPQITFRSTGFETLSETTGVLRGDLSVRGITRATELDVRINDAAMNRSTRKEMIGFSATGTVRRSAFGLTAYSEYVGDELALDIQVEFVRADQQAESPGGQR
ncbi:MAG: DUF6152 family protein [Pseudomonadota bacterium]